MKFLFGIMPKIAFNVSLFDHFLTLYFLFGILLTFNNYLFCQIYLFFNGYADVIVSSLAVNNNRKRGSRKFKCN